MQIVPETSDTSLSEKIKAIERNGGAKSLSHEFFRVLAISCKKASEDCNKIEEDSRRFAVKEETLQVTYGYRAR